MKSQFPLKALHSYLIFSLILFIGVQSLKFFSIGGPSFVFHYLNDILTIPIIATFCLHGVWFIKKDRKIRLGIFTIFSLFVFYSLFFEYYLPQQSHRYTADRWDVVCYFFGSLIFYLLQKSK